MLDIVGKYNGIHLDIHMFHVYARKGCMPGG